MHWHIYSIHALAHIQYHTKQAETLALLDMEAQTIDGNLAILVIVEIVYLAKVLDKHHMVLVWGCLHGCESLSHSITVLLLKLGITAQEIARLPSCLFTSSNGLGRV